MGRHSRRGPADTSDTTSTSGIQQAGAAKAQPKGAAPGPGRRRRGPGAPDATPAHGVPQATPPGGVPQQTPPHGIPQHTPPHGVPQQTPPHGVPQHTPPHGFPQHTPSHGVPHVRGGHPEQREAGGGWGEVGGTGAGPRMGAGYGVVPPQQRGSVAPGPRRDYVDAFGADALDDLDDTDVFAGGAAATRRTPPRDPYESVTTWDTDGPGGGGNDGDDGDDFDDDGSYGDDGRSEAGAARKRERNRGRTVTGIAAAAVTTVLAVVVAGQVTDGSKDDGSPARAAEKGESRDGQGSEASRSDNRPAPSKSAPAAPATYDQKMGKKYPLDAKLTAAGKFDAVRGFDKAPGKGQKFRYRVDVEKGMGLDGTLFAQAVQKTLNDGRSWAHGGGRTFERISSGKPNFVITLASPGTTAKWCAKSGLDTWQQNVSCDSAATDRVMINAYRWAQGAKTYGDRIHPYRQMLINHEVGHRLGYGHVDCRRDGELAPVMQQQTKFLNHDGIRCKANPWAFPKS
ncbi:DUF3152 domain-containing protein [Streptomyces lasiicapitis]|uniref:DUF3152 domain-containing protein n=1 Tax=Streptomyces lasiicapitis TaxID=1923961 RepID=A0ABQ2LI37_9ACTN|nr:DUF3152 domain-containing protein [Streptomyces lasiicapitis]GGO34188.1 hypothetical protein GCM10012286_02850 [Streptomyces lasiicapitis]